MSTVCVRPPIPNSYWVVPGRFAAGEYPGAKDMVDARAKLGTLLSAGITCFVDLTETGELLPYHDLLHEETGHLGLSVAHARHPIRDGKVPHSPTVMAGILDVIDAFMDEGKAVYVHCYGGIGRTGTVVGCWLVRHGQTGDAALDRIAQWWSGVEKVRLRPRSPETQEQCDYVRNWSEPGR